jgi:predicted dehydrogenase
MFARPLAEDFAHAAVLAAMCDPNPLRLTAAAAELAVDVPTFTDFDRMMRQIDPDGVIVAGRDCTHAQYVIAAVRAGKRAISEKPLCTTAEQCRQILAAVAESEGTCLVTHNCRYGAAEEAIREVIRSGRIGQPRFIQFDETLDRCHGADYFRRWHGSKANSGGLLIHKASHHFDVLNWWAGARPEWVSAQGALRFYGANGPFHNTRCRGCGHAGECDFHADMFGRELYRKLYLEAEAADGYFRDGCVFDPAIDIEDQMGVLIRYEGGLEVSYTLVAYSPYESQRIVIEGTEGRLEYLSRTNTGWVVDSKPLPGIEEIATEKLQLYLPAEGARELPIERPDGGHGGADPRLRAEFFGRDWDAAPTEQMASVDEAVQAVLVGAAANESMATGRPVAVQGLLDDR